MELAASFIAFSFTHELPAAFIDLLLNAVAQFMDFRVERAYLLLTKLLSALLNSLK